MGSERYIGRVGRLAAAIGVGTAVLFGVGCGVAAADETGSTTKAGPSASSGSESDATKKGATENGAAQRESPSPDPSSTPKPSMRGGAASSTKRPRDDAEESKDPSENERADGESHDDTSNDDTQNTEEETDLEQALDADAKEPVREANSSRPKKFAAPDEPTEAALQALLSVPGHEANDVELGVKPAPTVEFEVVTRPEPAPPVVLEPVKVESPQPDPPVVDDVDVVDVVVDAVSTVVSALLDPLSATSGPGAPAAQPQLWSALAVARRELETAFVGPKMADSEANPAAEEAITSSELAAVSADPTLTYTASPSLTDQITVVGLRILRAVSNVIGVDLFAEINKLLITKSPPFFLTFGIDARQSDVELPDGTTWKMWQFTPPDPTGKTVIAVHGSGFIYEPNLMQWYDYTSMARDTGATVLVPLYPLATTGAGSALNVIPDMADFISQQIDLSGAENVSVYGDSAGSIIAISAVRQLVLAGKPVASSMVLLSLTPDGSLSNPDIKTIDDPVIDVDNLGDYGSTHWGDGLADPTGPYYNALAFETLVGLPPTTIYVGSLEFVLPDTLLLHERAVDEGAPISVVVGRGQIHDWALGGLPINSQAPIVRKDVYRQLGLSR